jgi:DNA-binding response OmpR family regulator
MPTNSRRLLIVDEEPALLDSLTDLLIAEGYLVMPAANGREVLAFADKLPVDLALLDLDVLAENSRKTFKRLTRDHPHVPVIFATARSNHLPAEFGNGAGVLLKKPIYIPKLLRIVKRLLRPSPTPRASKVPGSQLL